YENFVATCLGHKGYEWLLPTYNNKRRWSDRVKEVELPLFPGYLFCKFNPEERLPILKTPGVISVVGFGRNPVPVDDNEIAALRALVNSGVSREPHAYLRTGQRVRIEHGALRGVEGILLEFRGRQRVVLSVTLLQRSVAVEIEGAFVKPLA